MHIDEPEPDEEILPYDQGYEGEIVDEIHKFLSKIRNSQYCPPAITKIIATATSYLEELPRYDESLTLCINYFGEPEKEAPKISGHFEILCGNITFCLKTYATLEYNYGREMETFTYCKWLLSTDEATENEGEPGTSFIDQMFENSPDKYTFSISAAVDECIVCEVEIPYNEDTENFSK